MYVETVLPEKMNYNLDTIGMFSLIGETAIMFRTAFAVPGRKYQ